VFHFNTVEVTEQGAVSTPIIIGRPFTKEAPSTTAQPTDRQFQRAVGQLSKIYADGSPVSTRTDSLPESLPTPVLMQMTGASMASFVGSEVTTQIVGDLRTQFCQGNFKI
jgi:hypothetical protein